MTIYADSSFLVSFLYPLDSNHAKAKAFLSLHRNDTWLTTAWSQFETVNSLRSLCLIGQGPSSAKIEAIRRFFKHLHRAGPFELEYIDWEEAIRDVNQISVALSSRLKARAADALHVAFLEQFSPDLFVTFDKAQAALAIARGFRSHHIR